MKVLVRMFFLARPQWPVLAIIASLGLAVAACNLGQAVLIAKVIVAMLTDGSFAGALVPLMAIAALLIARSFAGGIAEYLGTRVATAVKSSLRETLFRRLFELGPGWIGRHRSGLVQTALVDSLEMIQSYFSLIIPNTAISLISVVVLPIFVMIIDPAVGTLVMICALAATVIPIFTIRILRRGTNFWWSRYFPMNAEYLDSLQGMATLKSFNASRPWGDRLRLDAFAVRDAAIRLIKVEVIPTGVVHLLIAAGTTGALGFGALRVAGGQLAGADLITILFLVGQCFAPVLVLKRTCHYVYYVPTVAASILEVLDADPAVTERAASVPSGRLASSLRFENVHFTYPGARQPALQAIDLTVAAGTTVALVGRSGAGKSTVVSLLHRFFDPMEGRILLGDVDIRHLDLAELRRHFALVSQDIYLFHGTIRDNLLFANPRAKEADLVRAATMAAAHEFISNTPEGYDTVVGERGLKLSGGERQRIAIARALLKDAPILIFDEATSSIDLANEAAIQKSMATLMGNKTVLIIAHRLSTVRPADMVVVMDSGRIVEQGLPHALLEEQGAYARMTQLQEVY